jgi:hypothetical protein
MLDCHPRYSSSRSGRGENPPERQEVAWRGTGTLGHWDWGSGFTHWLAPCHPPFTVKPALTKMPHRTRFTLCDRLPTVQPIPAFTLSLFSLPFPSPSFYFLHFFSPPLRLGRYCNILDAKLPRYITYRPLCSFYVATTLNFNVASSNKVPPCILVYILHSPSPCRGTRGWIPSPQSPPCSCTSPVQEVFVLRYA